MKPAFTTLKIEDGGKQVVVTGPIDLDGSEYEGYIWVRVTQSADKDDPHGKPRVDGTGTEDSDETNLQAELTKARQRLRRKVKALKGDYTNGALERAVATATATWTATVKAEDNGLYRPNELARVEAWALVRTRNPAREFNVYWRENAVLIKR
jgi:hypothetical protein